MGFDLVMNTLFSGSVVPSSVSVPSSLECIEVFC